MKDNYRMRNVSYRIIADMAENNINDMFIFRYRKMLLEQLKSDNLQYFSVIERINYRGLSLAEKIAYGNIGRFNRANRRMILHMKDMTKYQQDSLLYKKYRRRIHKDSTEKNFLYFDKRAKAITTYLKSEVKNEK